jgi:hypothetical protein
VAQAVEPSKGQVVPELLLAQTQMLVEMALMELTLMMQQVAAVARLELGVMPQPGL